jgi:hypothetical protein
MEASVNRQAAEFPERPTRPSPERLRRPAALALLAALAWVAPRAEAWDPETHESIVRAAFALSPAAEARVPAEHRDAFFREVASPDSFDAICRFHNGPSARLDPAVEAEKTFTAIMSGRGPQSAYARTKMIGRFLHFVADTVVPSPIREGKVYTILDYFTLQDFVLFRERRSLTLPLAASLRQATESSRWPDDTPGARAYIYRLAVNVVADALLLLPPRADAAGAPDDGPAYFLLYRLRNLKGASDSRYTLVTTYDYSGGYYGRVQESTSVREERVGGDANPVTDMMSSRTLQIVERVGATNAAGSRLRVLLFNNAERCLADISLRFQDRVFPVPGRVPTQSLLSAEIQLPPGVRPDSLALFAAEDNCAPGEPVPGVVPVSRRVVLGLSGTPRDFRQASEAATVKAAPATGVSALGSSPHVRLNRSAMDGINDAPSASAMVANVEPALVKRFAGRLLFEKVTVDTTRVPWICRLLVRNTGEAALEGLTLTLLVTHMDRDKPDSKVKVQFDARNVAQGSTQELTALLTPTPGLQPVGLSVVDATGTSLPASRPLPIQNVVPKRGVSTS